MFAAPTVIADHKECSHFSAKVRTVDEALVGIVKLKEEKQRRRETLSPSVSFQTRVQFMVKNMHLKCQLQLVID